MRKKILMLNDRFSVKETNINLGERAMSSGIYQMIEKGLGHDIISGECKNFPCYNMKKYKQEKKDLRVEDIFQKWFDQTISRAKSSVIWEKKISNFLDKNILFHNRLFYWLDNKVKARFTRGLIETISPYILKKYYARQFIEKIRSADYALFNGTAIVSDRFAFYLPVVMFECFLAGKLGKKVVTTNQTIDIEDPDNFEMVSFVYKMLDLHFSREPLTKDTLLKMGIKEDKIISSCDAAFAADFSDNIAMDEIEHVENIETNSVALVIRGDRPVNYDLWIKIINHLESEYHKKAVMIFTCITQDLHVYNKLAKHCNLKRLSRFYDYPVLESLLKKFDFLIADRYHAIIFSIHAETPVLPINPVYKTQKTEGLFKLFRYPIIVMEPLNKDTYSEYLNSIEYIDKHRNELKEILARTHNDLRNKIEIDIKNISRLNST